MFANDADVSVTYATDAASRWVIPTNNPGATESAVRMHLDGLTVVVVLELVALSASPPGAGAVRAAPTTFTVGMATSSVVRASK
jgi:hypothetical protein